MRPALSLVLLSCGAAAAAAQTPLAWSLRPGQSFRAERVATQKQSVELKDKAFKQDTTSTWRVRVEVLGPVRQGHELRATLEAVQHRVTGTVPAEALDGALARKMQGQAFTLTVTPHGRVVDLRGHAEMLKQLAGAEPERLKALQVTLPEAAVQEALGDLFGPLPEKAVRPGDAWQRTSRDPIPHFGALLLTWRYADAGGPAGRHRLTYTIATKYQPPDDESPLFRVTKGELTAEDGRGTIVFDATAGRLVSHDRNMTVRGRLTLQAMGRELPLQLESENTVRVRTLPDEEAK